MQCVVQQIVDPNVRKSWHYVHARQRHSPRSKLTTAHSSNHNLHTLPWQSTSLDFNPIEDLWDVLDQNIKNQTGQELLQNLDLL